MLDGRAETDADVRERAAKIAEMEREKANRGKDLGPITIIEDWRENPPLPTQKEYSTLAKVIGSVVLVGGAIAIVVVFMGMHWPLATKNPRLDVQQADRPLLDLREYYG
jgi:hypothetical protein